MQKALERMNIKFHDVISSLTGTSGLAVIRAILAGETGGFGCLDRFPGELSGSACLFDYLLLDLFVNRFPRRAV